MIPKNNTPSVREIALAVLQFLAASPDEQIRALQAYQEMLKRDNLQPAHIWNPFVEIAEGMLKLCTEGSSEMFNPEALVAIEEVECVLELIFNQPGGCEVNDLQITCDPEWRVVRLLASNAINAARGPTSDLSVYEILCHVGD